MGDTYADKIIYSVHGGLVMTAFEIVIKLLTVATGMYHFCRWENENQRAYKEWRIKEDENKGQSLVTCIALLEFNTDERNYDKSH